MRQGQPEAQVGCCAHAWRHDRGPGGIVKTRHEKLRNIYWQSAPIELVSMHDNDMEPAVANADVVAERRGDDTQHELVYVASEM